VAGRTGGLRVVSMDGSTTDVPDSEKNHAFFGRPSNQSRDGRPAGPASQASPTLPGESSSTCSTPGKSAKSKAIGPERGHNGDRRRDCDRETLGLE